MSSFSPLDNLISQFEGFGTPGAPTITAGNNPGAVQYGPLAKSFGAYDVGPNGAALFSSLSDGLNALHAVEHNILSSGPKSADEFITAYEGGQPISSYSDYIARGLGIGPSDKIPSSALQPSGAAAPAGNQSPVGTLEDQLNQQLQSQINGGSGAGNVPPTTSGSPNGINTPANNEDVVKKYLGVSIPSFARIAAFVIGAGLIVGGIFFLRPVQEAVGTVRNGVEALAS